MQNEFNIRLASEADFFEISKIEKQCFSLPWSKNAVSQFAKSPNNIIIVCEKSGEICGYITASIVIDEVQIANVAVKENFRNMHIASFLLQKLIDISKGKNCISVTLEVRQSNIPAIKLYEKFGFSKVGERKNFYKNPTENAYLLTLNF